MHSETGGISLEHFTAIVGHVAWPITTIALVLVALNKIDQGLVGKLLPHGGEVEGLGFKVKTNAAQASIKEAQVDVAEVPPPAPETGITPYDRVMEAWRELAKAVTAKAVRLGGQDDQRRIYPNLQILRDKSTYPPSIIDGVANLFEARNSARKKGADSMAEDDAEGFIIAAETLKTYFDTQ